MMLHPNLIRGLEGSKFGRWKPSWKEMKDAVKWSRANYRHIGDFSSVRSGALDYLDGLYITQILAREASARAIMEKFVNKVDTGRARSKETYAEMKAWLEE